MNVQHNLPTHDFGFSTQPMSLSEMSETGMVNHPEERFILIIQGHRGKAKIRVNQQSMSINGNTLLILLPDFHVEIESDQGFTAEYIYYTFDFMADFPFALHSKSVEKIGQHPSLELSRSEQREVQRLIQLLKRQYARLAHPSRVEIVKASLYLVIAEIGMLYMQRVGELHTSHTEMLIDQFFQLVHRHAQTEHKAAFYADRLCLTVRYLSKLLKLKTGKTLNTWVSDLTIQSAKKMLKSTDLTIAQIADDMHFPNPSFFAKYFKRQTGMTPIEFRRLT